MTTLRDGKDRSQYRKLKVQLARKNSFDWLRCFISCVNSVGFRKRNGDGSEGAKSVDGVKRAIHNGVKRGLCSLL